MITYERDRELEPEAVASLYRSAGLRRPVDDLDRMGRMLTHANLTISAWDGGTLVGIARSLTDFAFCCYLSDLAVHGDYQSHGIGKELVRLTAEAIGDEAMLLLLSAPNAMTYYPHIGFEKVENGWIIHRKR